MSDNRYENIITFSASGKWLQMYLKYVRKKKCESSKILKSAEEKTANC